MKTSNDDPITTSLPGPIEGVNTCLYCISIQDAPAIADLMTPDVSQWLASWPANPTVEAVIERITRAQNAMQEKRELHFRIAERERNLSASATL
jgi:hypothetical protein